MSPIGAVHVVLAVTGIVTGAAVLYVGPKGGRLHRQLGWTYVTSMLGANITALMIYRLFGGFGPFHFAALISLFSITSGTLNARAARRARLRRDEVTRARRIVKHYWSMAFGYVGLIAAFTSEIIVRVPAIRAMMDGVGAVFGIAVLGMTLLTFAVGTILILARRARVLAPFLARSAPPAA